MRNMGKMARYEMIRPRNNNEGGRMQSGGNMRGEMQQNEMRGGMQNEMRGGMQNEMRGEMGGDMNYSPDQRRRFPRREDGTFKPRNNRTYEYSEMRDEMGGGDMRGEMRRNYGRNEMRGGFEMEDEEMQRGAGGRGNIIGFDTRIKRGGSEPLTQDKAREWVKKMKHADGGMGEHWNMELVKKMMSQKGVDLEPAEMYAIINALYSDFGTVFEKHGVTSPEFYLDMAKAWIEDPDAVKHKTSAYYEHIVKK